jgi:YfiH family protein
LTPLGNPIETTIDLSDHLERSALLSEIPWIRHGVTRRVPGLGLADGNVGYTAPRDGNDAWQMRQLWARAVGVEPSQLVRVRQVHGSAVHIADASDLARGTHPEASESPVGDAVITSEPGIALSTLHADCLAALIADPVRRVVGSIHAGWRSTVRDISGETVRTMTLAFGSRPEDLIAYIGPSIGIDRYEVGHEVAAAWRAVSDCPDLALHEVSGGWHFDLKRANAQQLTAAGVRPERIEISTVCTASEPDRWFSHRGQGPLTGRFATIIAIVDERPGI